MVDEFVKLIESGERISNRALYEELCENYAYDRSVATLGVCLREHRGISRRQSS